MKIGILTDSSSGLTQEKIKNTDIYTLPLHIITEDTDEFLDTPENAEKKDLIHLIKTQILKTSQISPGEMKMKLNELFTKYDHIIYFPVSEKLSNQYNTACMIANETEFKNKFFVFKTIITGFAIEKLVIILSEYIKKGKNVKELLQISQEFQDNVHTYLIPEDLSRLNKSGRVPKSVIALINVLKVKIIIEWNSNPKRIGIGKNVQKLVRKIVSNFESLNNKYDFYLLTNFGASQKIINSTEETLKENKIKYDLKELPNIFAVHAGLDTLGFIFIPKK
ncbi:DegV family protein [Spiroplasma endosymbiont of Amphibalanus improvisus]|uniref:DegV family protein n=1 Tax=Spiroplasma endosymbiont of Amphibalanus improvisus TaxID=3066327 RepID=UPI00313D962C